MPGLGVAALRHLLGDARDHGEGVVLLAGVEHELREVEPHARAPARAPEVGGQHGRGPLGARLAGERPDRLLLGALRAALAGALEDALRPGPRLEEDLEGPVVDLEELAVRGGDDGGRAGPPGERRHLAEEVADVEPPDLERPPVPAHDQDAHAAGGDEEDAVSGVALAHHDSPGGHEATVEAVRDAAEYVVLEVGEERARERLAPRPRGTVAEAPRERQQFLVEGERVLARPAGAGLLAGGPGAVGVGLLLGLPARGLGRGDPGPGGPGERLEALADLGVARRHRVRAPQGLEGAVGEAVAGQLVRHPEQDGNGLLAVVREHQEVGEAEALGEGRRVALELGAEHGHRLRVLPLGHELVDARGAVGTGEPVEDHGRAPGIVLRGPPRRRHERRVADLRNLPPGAEGDEARTRPDLVEHPPGGVFEGDPRPRRGRPGAWRRASPGCARPRRSGRPRPAASSRCRPR